MLYTIEMKGGAGKPPPPRKPPLPTEAAQAGQGAFDAQRRKNRGFLSTILTGGSDTNSLLGS